MTNRRLSDDTRAAILDWFVTNRRPLPFRATTDPWAIMLSEVIAQQTQAARAGQRWIGFLASYPTPAALAATSPAEVLRAWQGLGYNRRALNLWRAARQIVQDHDGKVPADVPALEALPGVGPYTARAVAAIAFGLPVGPVDTNVRRVLGRILAGEPAALDGRQLQAVADAAVPPDRAGDWTHALMDLGAMICRPRRPACNACPARAGCRYVTFRGGRAVVVEGGRAVVVEGGQRPTRGRRVAQPFPQTTRWLRGRIMDRLRATDGDGWTVIVGPIGSHDDTAVAAALVALANEGLVELDGHVTSGDRRARLPVA